MLNFLVILLLAGIGAVARDYITQTFPKSTLGTLFVNSIGGFLTGILFQSVMYGSDFYNLMMLGFLGGFTTYSTFTKDQYVYLKDKKYANLILYTVMTFIFALSFFYLGIFVTK